MKKLVKLIISLVVILVGALLIVPFLIPMETYKQEAATRLSEMTGRNITIDGDISFRILPDVAVVVQDVTVGNPKGFSSPYLAKVKQLNIGVALQPLFSKELVIQAFALEQPDVYLETNTQGMPNWQIDFKPPELPDVSVISSAYADDGSSFALKKLELSKLSVTGGKLTYSEAGSKHVLEDIALASDKVNMNQPTDIVGSFAWNREAFKVSSRIHSLENLINNKVTDAVVGIDSAPIKISFNGKLAQTAIRGALDAGSPSIVKTMQWLGSPMEWNKTALLFAIKGQVNCNISRCEIADANIALDDMRLNGSVTASYAGKPSVTAELNADTLDLMPYLKEETARSSWLIPSAYAADNWSSDPIDLSGLKAVNVDVMLNANKISFPQLTLKKVKAQPQVRNGAASLNVIQASLFQGGMNGVVTAIPRDNYINTSAKLNFNNIEMEQLLKALTGDDQMAGNTNLSASLTARGNSIAGLIQTLGGTGKLAIKDGAIKGVNLAQMSRNITSAFTAESLTEKTDFASLTASFKVVNGLIINEDLNMMAPFLRMTGKGSINLPAYTISYRLLPELVKTATGQEGKIKSGILVPVLVSGSLDNPQFAPDLQNIIEETLNNPEKMKENIGAIKEEIKDKKQDLKEIKKQFKDIKKDIKKDPGSLLKNPDKLNELLQGF